RVLVGGHDQVGEPLQRLVFRRREALRLVSSLRRLLRVVDGIMNVLRGLRAYHVHAERRERDRSDIPQQIAARYILHPIRHCLSSFLPPNARTRATQTPRWRE